MRHAHAGRMLPERKRAQASASERQRACGPTYLLRGASKVPASTSNSSQAGLVAPPPPELPELVVLEPEDAEAAVTVMVLVVEAEAPAALSTVSWTVTDPAATPVSVTLLPLVALSVA